MLRLRHGALAVATCLATAAALAQSPVPASGPPQTTGAAAPATEAAPSPSGASSKSGATGAAPGNAERTTGSSAAGAKPAARVSGVPGGLTVPSSGGGRKEASTKSGADGGKGSSGYPRRGNLQSVYADVMSDSEKSAFREKVRKVKTYGDCKALLEATHETMEPRAKAQGKTLPQTPAEACDRAKERGRVTG